MLKKALLLLALSLQPALCLAQNPPCLNLTPVANPVIAYTLRGNLCEGFYQASVSAGSLDLVSLLHGQLTFTPGQNTPLRITSPDVHQQAIHVQAVGIPLRTYYRLDALLQPGGTLDWPLNIVNGMSVRPDQIGLFGQLANDEGSYVPLAVTGATAAPAAPLNLILRSSVDVSVVRWRHNVMRGMQCDLSQSDWQSIAPSSGGRFFAGQPIALSLPPQQNNFCIEFAAQNADFANFLKLLLNIRMNG
jgi:hypothetical protein